MQSKDDPFGRGGDDDERPLATVSVTISRGMEPGSLRVRQEGSGNVLLRFEALIAAAAQLLQTAMTQAVPNPDQVDAELVTQTLAGYIAGQLDPNAEQLVSVALDALSPRESRPAEDIDEEALD